MLFLQKGECLVAQAGRRSSPQEMAGRQSSLSGHTCIRACPGRIGVGIAVCPESSYEGTEKEKKYPWQLAGRVCGHPPNNSPHGQVDYASQVNIDSQQNTALKGNKSESTQLLTREIRPPHRPGGITRRHCTASGPCPIWHKDCLYRLSVAALGTYPFSPESRRCLQREYGVAALESMPR